MRVRVGLFLCLLSIIAGLGCRKALAPNIDRNKAPETWITAAPFDTITLVKGVRPQTGTIPVRFHVYWAGSDQDGAVVGYYWAVTETTTAANLPGPRARDYHFTSKSDSTFIFNVGENNQDRQHAFYIYSVDNQGKGDPTPARFIFNANEQYPPLAVFDQARATGTVFSFDAGGVLRSSTRTFDIRDSLTLLPYARDTVPSGSRLTFRYHGEPTLVGSVVKGYRFKLDESELQPTAPESLWHKNIVEYGVPPEAADPARNGRDIVRVAPGDKVFTLRAVDQANGSKIGDFTRRFQVNFSPDTWFAGPDSTVADGLPSPWARRPSCGSCTDFVRYAVLRDVLHNGPAGLPGTLLSADSVVILPAARKPMKTFLELWGETGSPDTVYLRREFDTVHLNAYLIFHNGGFDTDSKYDVKVADHLHDIMPEAPSGPVLEKAGPNGSPIGFRNRVTTLLTGTGLLSFTAQSRLYPVFDPNDSQHFPRIGAYQPAPEAGQGYALERAEDSDGARDNRIEDARNQVRDHPHDPLTKALVMVFNVDFPPEFLTSSELFVPKADGSTVFIGQDWVLDIQSVDIDPYVSGDPHGGSLKNSNIRPRFRITGLDRAGQPFTFSVPPAAALDQQRFLNQQTNVQFRVPDELGAGPVTITVELCDCAFCESNGGEGRCITRDFQATYAPSGSARAARVSRPGSH